MKDKTSSDIFHFKQFDVAQEHCAMKIGTDGVLLGALCPLPDTSSTPLRLLDIGTGTGLIALMLAQKLSDGGIQHFHIDAVEIDPQAAQQARENAEASPWSDNIEIHACSLHEFSTLTSNDIKYDVIVSNPPFYNATLKPEDEARAVARHKDALPLDEISKFSRNHLNDNGLLALIYPTDYDTEVMTSAIAQGLTPRGLCHILTKVGKPCKRRISWFGAAGANIDPSTPLQTHTLAIRDAEGNYTDEYKNLTEPFYVSLR